MAVTTASSPFKVFKEAITVRPGDCFMGHPIPENVYIIQANFEYNSLKYKVQWFTKAGGDVNVFYIDENFSNDELLALFVAMRMSC